MSGKTEPAGDPSMDDILASIRRILDEEETKPAKAEPPEDVLELEPSMMVPEPDETAPGPVPGPPPILLEPVPPAERPVSQSMPPLPAPLPGTAVPLAVPVLPVPPPPAPAASPLIAPAAAAAAASSVGALMRTLASERTTAVNRGGPTIEDLVREEMRPLVKEWLDIHLAPMVERLVQAEIERVVNRQP